MAECCVQGCSNTYSTKANGVTFHRFPEHPGLRVAWIAAIQRENWQPSRGTRICSEHFSKDQISFVSSFGGVRLKNTAVPDILNPLRNKRDEPDKDPNQDQLRRKKQDLLHHESSFNQPSTNGFGQNPERQKYGTEYCKIAARPSRTAPVVITLKRAASSSEESTELSSAVVTTQAPSTFFTTLVNPFVASTFATTLVTPSAPSNFGTALFTPPVPTTFVSTLVTPAAPTSVTNSTASLTSPQPISLFSQILSAPVTPMIASTMPSIIATNVGNILTGIPQTVTVPVAQSFASPLPASVNPLEPTLSRGNPTVNNTNNVIVSEEKYISLIEKEKKVDKLLYKNSLCCRKIHSLQKTVHRQKQVIEHLTNTIRAMNRGKRFSRKGFMAEYVLPGHTEAGSEQQSHIEGESALEGLSFSNILEQISSDSSQSDDSNLEADEFNFKEGDLNLKCSLNIGCGESGGVSCADLLETVIKVEPNEQYVEILP